jgi:hypothetical protein
MSGRHDQASSPVLLQPYVGATGSSQRMYCSAYRCVKSSPWIKIYIGRCKRLNNNCCLFWKHVVADRWRFLN